MLNYFRTLHDVKSGKQRQSEQIGCILNPRALQTSRPETKINLRSIVLTVSRFFQIELYL